MNKRGIAVLSLAAASVAAEVLACPTVPVCIPSACLEMHRDLIRTLNRGSAGTSSAFTSLNVTLQAQLTLNQIGGGADGSSLYGWTDPLTSREYALMGRSNGTAIVDITIPTDPKYVANIPKQTGTSDTLWREPKVYKNHAYIGVDGTTHAMQIVDLTQVRNYAGTTLTLASTSYAGLTRVHTLAINQQTGYLYASGTNLNSGAPHIINVNNPGSPVSAGNVPGGAGFDGYSHEAQVLTYTGPDSTYNGREIMISSNGKQGGVDTLSVVDVTNKAAPVRLSSKTYPQAGYIHQGWFTEDQRYFFQNDELDEPGVGQTRTHLWDMADLNNPVYRGFYRHNGSSIDHNLYVKNGYVFEANYTRGLRILKIGNLQSENSADWLTEVAWFDTYTPSDSAIFAGAWNVFPFFASGNVVVSDIDGGLFVLRPNLPGWNNGQGLGLPNPFNDIGPFVLAPEPSSALALASAALVLCRRHRR